MTRDDIIRMAWEQGYDFNPAMKLEDAIEIAYQLGAAAERESMRAELEAALQDRVALAAENERMRGEIAMIRKEH